jgi:putrescine:ornithine antiporter
MVMGVAQSALALSTISPSLSEQFSVLVNLAVVTNVVPSSSRSRAAGDDAGGRNRQPSYRRTILVMLVALAYSVYALFASGKDAVFGGLLAWGVGLVIWGFIAPRFSTGAQAQYRHAA